MTTKLKNTLASCLNNPYLLQHAYNPVHWMPWGPQAHRLAKELNRPIFLSIGYTSCHWCHVMERESFENEDIAQMLNDWFISIKVDKEERPDIDRFYMTFIQATTGSAGWPLSVFLTPDLKPFAGGSYFTPEDKYGRTGFKTILTRIHEVWKDDRTTIDLKAGNMVNMLKMTLLNKTMPDQDVVQARSLSFSDHARRFLHEITQRFRKHYGGFSDAPLFPRPSEMQCLLMLSATAILNKDEKKRALDMVLHTLRKMSQGGIHDHIGGGFSRYSVDECWHVPHFEKMLYDNAQLLQTFACAYRASRNPYFALIGIDIFDYIKRDMKHKSGVFFASQDADSRPAFDSSESREGAYYVFSRQEIVDQVPGIEGDIFCFHYNIMEGGNCNLSVRSDPRGEFQGLNVPIELGDDPILQTALHFKLSRDDVVNILRRARDRLRAYREKTRPAPVIDDKIVTAWNAMMISACAHAHCAFSVGRGDGIAQRSDYLEVAVQAMKSLEENSFVVNESTGRKELVRSIRFVDDKIVRGYGVAFADDYACMIAAYLDLYEATGDHTYIERARQLQNLMDVKFKDENWYLFGDTKDDPSVLVQFPEISDGAEPSPNSVAAGNLYRLHNFVEADDGTPYLDMANAIWNWAQPTIVDVSHALPLLVANKIVFEANIQHMMKIVITSLQYDDVVKAFLYEIWARYLPSMFLICITTKDAHDYFSSVNPVVQNTVYADDDRQAQVQLCYGFQCLAPITQPEDLAKQLDLIQFGAV